jgi:hypothetical protein
MTRTLEGGVAPGKITVIPSRADGEGSVAKAPSSKEVPNPNLQKDAPPFRRLCLILLWNVDLGAWSFRRVQFQVGEPKG